MDGDKSADFYTSDRYHKVRLRLQEEYPISLLQYCETCAFIGQMYYYDVSEAKNTYAAAKKFLEQARCKEDPSKFVLTFTANSRLEPMNIRVEIRDYRSRKK